MWTFFHAFRDSTWTRSAPATKWSYLAHRQIGQMSMTSARRTTKYTRTLWRRWIWLDVCILFLPHNFGHFTTLGQDAIHAEWHLAYAWEKSASQGNATAVAGGSRKASFNYCSLNTQRQMSVILTLRPFIQFLSQIRPDPDGRGACLRPGPRMVRLKWQRTRPTVPRSEHGHPGIRIVKFWRFNWVCINCQRKA